MHDEEAYTFIPLLPTEGESLRWHEQFVLKVRLVIKKLLNLWKTKTTKQ